MCTLLVWCLFFFGAAAMPTNCPKEPAERAQSITQTTHLSAKFAYNYMRSNLPKWTGPDGAGRALDLGAGLGYSTKVLHDDLNYGVVDAVDQSKEAWDLCKYASDLSGVTFHLGMDVSVIDRVQKYDAINVAFGMLESKAKKIAQDHLNPNGIMVAPVANANSADVQSGHDCLTVFKLSAQGVVDVEKRDCKGHDGYNARWQQDRTVNRDKFKLVRKESQSLRHAKEVFEH